MNRALHHCFSASMFIFFNLRNLGDTIFVRSCFQTAKLYVNLAVETAKFTALFSVTNAKTTFVQRKNGRIKKYFPRLYVIVNHLKKTKKTKDFVLFASFNDENHADNICICFILFCSKITKKRCLVIDVLIG